ncbi:MAG: Ig-like domain-containing protein [Myxococcota bacterium]
MDTSTLRNRLLTLAALPLVLAAGCGGDSAGSDTDAANEDGSTGEVATTEPGEDPTGSTPPSTTGDDSTGDDPTGGADDDSMADSTSTGELEDDTGSGDTVGAEAPSIEETSPADGDDAVTADTALVVRFSEPMDMVSVQQAYQSADIPAASVTFEWNEAGDELTVIPNEELPYAFGQNPATVAANAFSYTISTVAESAEGVALEEPVEVSFTTLRRISQHFERDETLSAQMRDDGFLGLQPYIGDYTLDEATRRYLLTFDLSSVPSEVTAIEQADFFAAWASDLGDPWISLGGVLYRQVSYENLVPATFNGPAHTDNYALFVSESNFVSIDVSSELQSVLDDPGTFDDRLQFRLRWAIENNLDMDHDGLTLNEDLLELDLVYLTP